MTANEIISAITALKDAKVIGWGLDAKEDVSIKEWPTKVQFCSRNAIETLSQFGMPRIVKCQDDTWECEVFVGTNRFYALLDSDQAQWILATYPEIELVRREL